MKTNEIGKVSSYMVKNTIGSGKPEVKKTKNTTPKNPMPVEIIGTPPLKPLTEDTFVKNTETTKDNKEPNQEQNKEANKNK